MTIGIKERLMDKIFSKGIDLLKQRMDIPELEKRYGPAKGQVLKLDVEDVNLKPVYLTVVNSEIRRLYNVKKADVEITFKSLSGLLNVLSGNWYIDQIFAYDGCVLRNGKLVKEISYEGDWVRSSVLLQKIFDEYLEVMREILFKDLKIGVPMRWGYKVINKVSGWNR